MIATPLAGARRRYRRDLTHACARLAAVERRTVPGRHGPIEFAAWAGTGEPVLLIHGLLAGCDVARTWRSLVPPGRPIIAPSRFGYLASPLPADATIATQADAYVDLLDALGVERAAVLSYSAGASSAVAFALRHACRASALALVSVATARRALTLVPAGIRATCLRDPWLWSARSYAPWLAARIAGLPRHATERERRDLDAILDALAPAAPRREGALFDLAIGMRAITDLPLECVTVPTIAVHARDDRLAPIDPAQRLVARIPGSRFVALGHGGHAFVYRDAAARAAIATVLDVDGCGSTPAEVPAVEQDGAE